MKARMKKLSSLLGVLLLLLFLGGGWYFYQKSPKVITIGYYSDSSWEVPNDQEYKFIDYAIKKFEKENPHVKVKYESGISKNDYLAWLSNKIIKNQMPDVFVVPPRQLGFLASLKAMKKLDNFINIDKISPQNYYPASWMAGNYQGNQYAIPLENNPTLMCVNTDLLSKEGIEIPHSGWTVQEFYDICRRVTKDTNHDGVIDQYGYADYTWQDTAQAYGAKLFNDSGTESYLNSEKFRKSLVMTEKLYNLQKGYQVSADDFDQGKVAFLPMTLAQYRTYESYPYRISRYSTFSWACIRMPAVNNRVNATVVDTSMVAMAAHSHHPYLAWKFMTMLSYDNQVQTKLFDDSQGAAVLKKVMQSKNVEVNLAGSGKGDQALTAQKFISIMAKSQNVPKFKEYNAALGKADYLINRALQNGDISTQLSDIQNQIQVELKSGLDKK